MSTASKVTTFAWAALMGALVVLLVHYRRAAGADEKEVASIVNSLAERRRAAVAQRQRLAVAERLAERHAAIAQAAKQRKRSAMPSIYTENMALTKAAYLPLVRKFFSAAYARSGLTAERIAELEELLLQLGPELEIVLAIGTFHDDPEQDARMEGVAGYALLAEVREKFGEQAGDAVELAIRARDVHRAVDDLAVRQALTGAPLDTRASEWVTALLIEAGDAAGRERKVRLQTLDWDLVMRRAPEVLTPAQMRGVAALRTRALFDREYERVTHYVAEKALPPPER